MAPRTRPPATTERRVFLREGVTAASATRGLASAAAVPATTAAESFSTLELLVRDGEGAGMDGSENIHSCASWQRLPRASGRRIGRAQLDASFVDP